MAAVVISVSSIVADEEIFPSDGGILWISRFEEIRVSTGFVERLSGSVVRQS